MYILCVCRYKCHFCSSVEVSNPSEKTGTSVSVADKKTKTGVSQIEFSKGVSCIVLHDLHYMYTCKMYVHVGIYK